MTTDTLRIEELRFFEMIRDLSPAEVEELYSLTHPATPQPGDFGYEYPAVPEYAPYPLEDHDLPF